MRLRSMGASVASLMLVTVIGAGCAHEDKGTATRAEQAMTRAEDAAKRAESAASRVEAASARAEAAAEKAERATMHGMRKEAARPTDSAKKGDGLAAVAFFDWWRPSR